MTMFCNRFLRLAVLGMSVAVAPGCDSFLDVKNPNTLEAESVDE
jgi:hypothetical protein